MDSLPSTGNVLLDITILLITGGAVTTWLTLFFDRTSKRRAEYIDIIRYKIEKISKAEIYYTQLATNFRELSFQFNGLTERNEVDYRLCMYYFAQILFLQEKFSTEIAYMMLGDLDAEDILANFMYDVPRKFQQEKGIRSTGPISKLVDEKTTFDMFCINLDHNAELFCEFRDWLSNIKDKEELLCLERKCKWFCDLIVLELNRLYGLYYGESNLKHFYRDHQLDRQLVQYLFKNHNNYYKRLVKLRLIDQERE